VHVKNVEKGRVLDLVSASMLDASIKRALVMFPIFLVLSTSKE
jgi:hypothetical protein